MTCIFFVFMWKYPTKMAEQLFIKQTTIVMRIQYVVMERCHFHDNASCFLNEWRDALTGQMSVGNVITMDIWGKTMLDM